MSDFVCEDDEMCVCVENVHSRSSVDTRREPKRSTPKSTSFSLSFVFVSTLTLSIFKISESRDTLSLFNLSLSLSHSQPKKTKKIEIQMEISMFFIPISNRILCAHHVLKMPLCIFCLANLKSPFLSLEHM